MTEPPPSLPPSLPPGPPMELRLASTLADTARLHAWLDGVLAPLPAGQAHAMRLCLEEAVMNVVLHGHGPGQPGTILVAVWPGPGRACAWVEDDARAFDPLQVHQPVRRAGLQDGPVGGRGVALIRRFASAVQYRRQDGRNRLTMEFDALPPATRPR